MSEPFSISPQPYPMTVVMATLGGDTLRGTIEQLNRGSVVPAEILVCIPKQEAARMANLLFPNVRMIVTKCRGQVAQRAVGFQNASHDIVMQLDDDIIVDENCIACLLQTLIKYGPHVAVAPALDSSSGKIPRMNDTMLRIFYFLVNGREGYQMGAVSRSGYGFGYDTSMIKEGVHDVEWVPGGCVMHFRDNLIKENYFPYKGKAYCEDLLHSHHLIKKGVSLKVVLHAHCSLKLVSWASYGIKEFISTFSGYYRAKIYFVSLTSRSYLRMHLYYIAIMSNYLIKKLIAGIRR